MKKGILIGIIAGVALILIAGFFVFTRGNSSNTLGETDSNQMIDCGKLDNPACFSNRMDSCLPVTAQLTATDGSPIVLTIWGYENEKCHLQRKVNGIISFECYFPQETDLSWDLVDQTFGNEKGLQDIVDNSCQSV